MIKLTERTMRNAIAKSLLARCRVRYLGANRFEVRCINDHLHIVTVGRDQRGALEAECMLDDTCELCPSEQGHRACYHMPGAVSLFLAITEQRIGRTVEQKRQRDCHTHQIKVSFVKGRKVEKLRGVQI